MSKNSNQPTAYLMVGIPGSGKSTWIKENLPSNIVIISRDIIRSELGFTANADEKAALSYDKEELVTNRQQSLIKHYLHSGVDIVIDDINTGKFRRGMIRLLHSYGAKVVAVVMNTPLETCIQRRNGQIPADVMQNIYKRAMALDPSEVDEVISVPDNTQN